MLDIFESAGIISLGRSDWLGGVHETDLEFAICTGVGPPAWMEILLLLGEGACFELLRGSNYKGEDGMSTLCRCKSAPERQLRRTELKQQPRSGQQTTQK